MSHAMMRNQRRVTLMKRIRYATKRGVNVDALMHTLGELSSSASELSSSASELGEFSAEIGQMRARRALVDAARSIVLIGAYQDGGDFYAERDVDLVSEDNADSFLIDSYGCVSGDHDDEGVREARRLFAVDHPEHSATEGGDPKSCDVNVECAVRAAVETWGLNQVLEALERVCRANSARLRSAGDQKWRAWRAAARNLAEAQTEEVLTIP